MFCVRCLVNEESHVSQNSSIAGSKDLSGSLEPDHDLTLSALKYERLNPGTLGDNFIEE